MKKLTVVFLALVMTLLVFSTATEASTYSLKHSNLKLPNLYNYSVAKQLKAGTYKYYGVKLGMTKKSLYSTWGPAASASVERSYGTTDGMYFYGNDWQVAVLASYNNSKIATDRLRIDYISIGDNYRKYELTQLKKYFGSPTSTYTSGQYKSYSYGDDLDITFTKVRSKWYVEEITFTDYRF